MSSPRAANTYLDPWIGPARAWLTWSLPLAALGFRSLRADLSGLGDSPPRPGTPGQLPYSPHAVSDVAALIAAADTGSGVAVVGSCSGARNVLDAAAEVAVNDVLLANPAIGQPRSLLERMSPEDLVHEDFGDREASWVHRWSARGPGPLWWAAARLGVLESRSAQVRTALSLGASAFVVSSPQYLMMQPRNARWAMRPQVRSGQLEVHTVAIDAALFDPTGRARMLELMTSYLERRHPPQAAAGSGGRAATG